MKFETSIIIYATDEARKKNEGKEKPVKNKKSSCPSCDLENMRKAVYKEDLKKAVCNEQINNDYNNKEKE
jgi:hypothetical protein